MGYKYNNNDIIRNIQTGLNLGLYVCTSTVLCKYNVDTYSSTLQFLKSIGVKQTLSDIAICDVNQKNVGSSFLLTVEEIIRLVKKYPHLQNERQKKSNGSCKVGYTELYISANGDVLPCSTYSSIMGNIYNNTLIEIKEGRSAKELRCLNWSKIENCLEKCKFIEFCVPCYGRNLNTTGSSFKCSPELKAKARGSMECYSNK